MKYYVTARDNWNSDLEQRFGEDDSLHDLSDAEVVEAIMTFGRAEITDTVYRGSQVLEPGTRNLEFQNGYD